MQPHTAAQTLQYAPTVRENAASDPFELLKADHDAFRALLAAFPLADTQRRRVIALELSREIVAHASIEERFLHELYRKHLPKEEGDTFFADSLTADQRNIEALYTLEKETADIKETGADSDASHRGGNAAGVAGGAGHPQPAASSESTGAPTGGFKSPTVPGLSKATCDAFRQLHDTETVHMREEEELYFPKLRAAMSLEQQKELYRSLVSAKKDAPTHASFLTVHRPDNPTLAKIVHPIAGAIDRASDALLGRK